MASATGQYATLLKVKRQANITDTTDDDILQDLCDGVNSEIESFTHRKLCPVVNVSTTLTVQANVGATSITVGSTTGALVGESVMLGDLTGVHEAVPIAAVTSSTVLGLGFAIGNQYMVGKAVQSTYFFDGDDAEMEGRVLSVPMGIQSIALLENTSYTGGPFTPIVGPSYNVIGDWFFQPNPQEREPGWPWLEVWITNIPSSGTVLPTFPKGFNNIRLTGKLGWPAIPDDVTIVATRAVIREWGGRQAGQADIVGTDLMGRPIVSRFLSLGDRERLSRYVRRSIDII